MLLLLLCRVLFPCTLACGKCKSTATISGSARKAHLRYGKKVEALKLRKWRDWAAEKPVRFISLRGYHGKKYRNADIFFPDFSGC